MQIEAVAGRYAKALLDLASESNQVKAYGDELERFGEVFDASAELRLILSNPSIPKTERKKVIGSIIEHLKLSRIVGNFLRLLVDRGRAQYTRAIITAYEALRDDHEGRLRGKVVSAFALSVAQRKQLTDRLQGMLGREVLLSEEVQPHLIGGLRVEIGGKTFDGSLRGQLERLRATLTRPGAQA